MGLTAFPFHRWAPDVYEGAPMVARGRRECLLHVQWQDCDLPAWACPQRLWDEQQECSAGAWQGTSLSALQCNLNSPS